MFIIRTQSGQQYTLREGENSIGRGSDCDLRVEFDKMSRHHASIRWDGQQAVIRDLGSTNGTWVNETRIEPDRDVVLKPGDVLYLGGPGGRLEVGLTSGPVAPIPEPSPAPRAETRQKIPSWLWVAGACAILLLIFSAAVLLTRRLAEGTPTPAPLQAQATPLAEAAVPPTPVGPTVEATSTPIPQPTRAAVALPTVAKPRPGAAPIAQMPMPPINPTSMPAVVASLVGEFAPAEVRVALATLVPNLLGGTPGVALPGNLLTPAPPIGSRRYGAPVLKGPANGSSYHGEGNPPILEWEPVQGLQPNDYYRVIVFYRPGNQELAGGTWMKGTSYVVPGWFLSQYSGHFEWQVVVSQATGLPENGGKLGATVSDPSERRWFIWTVESGGEPEEPPGKIPIATRSESP